MKADLSETQAPLVELLESSLGEEIDGIGEPTLDGDRIIVVFQYGADSYTATIDPDAGTISY